MPASVVPVSKSACDLVLFVALTLKPPSFPSLAALRSTAITSCSFVLELNLSARLIVVLPHLIKRKYED